MHHKICLVNGVSEFERSQCTYNNHNFIRNRTSNTEIGRAKTGFGFASPISVLQVLF